MSARPPLIWLAGLLLLLGSLPAAEKAPINVDGLGFLANLKMRNTLRELKIDNIDQSFIEDSVFFIEAQLDNQGYLKPTIEVTIVRQSGEKAAFLRREGQFEELPDEVVEGQSMKIEVSKGPRYTFDKIIINGLPEKQLSEAEARRFFIAGGFLIKSEGQRIYSDDRLAQGVGNLVQRLRNDGYRDASAEVVERQIDHETAEAAVRIQVTAGPRFRIAAVDELLATESRAIPGVSRRSNAEVDRVYSPERVRGLRLDFRDRLFAQGYPEARITERLELLENDIDSDERPLRLVLTARPGPKVTFGGYSFEGAPHVSKAFLHKRTRLKTGEPLDPLQVEEDRFRLGRLGIFDSIESQMLKQGEERPVRMILKEGKRQEASIRVGFGSYDGLRVGATYQHNNLWRRAHKFRAQALQTFKSSAAELRYTIPDVFAWPATFNGRFFGIQREEVSFTRQEFLTELGLSFMENDSGERYGVRYRYSFLQTTDLEVGDFEAPEEALVGAINPYYEIDRRDSALNPRDGYRLGGELEVASRVLGSEVDYRLLDLGGSYHQEFTTGWWAHAALRAAIIEASSQDEIPLNKRFLPGGASSIRGYTDGEAAALNADGDIVGSEALLLTNLEVERALAQSFSAVIFYDALWTDLDAEDFPGDDFLHSVGLGLRYETPLGPLRLEYGYNLNPRPRDPAGAFHVSLGAPF